VRRRYQNGSLKRANGKWIAQYWEDGHRRNKTLGKLREMAKSEAQRQLAALMAPINAQCSEPSPSVLLKDFIEGSYLPFYGRKWKRSTAMTTQARLRTYLVPELGGLPLSDLNRERLQSFLEDLAARGLSRSTVDHVRWDLRQILRLAVTDGYLQRNPADCLFVPREATVGEVRRMTKEEVIRCLDSLGGREKLVVKLAILGGLRPGEILALRCGRVSANHVEIKERLYRTDLDSPKTRQSVRKVALPQELCAELQAWCASLPEQGPDAWVFPSERLTTPINKDNLWQRNIAPVLAAAGLDWVNFQVFRRTHATLMRESGADPKLVADNMGHLLGVNLDVYTKTTLPMRHEAVEALASQLVQ